MKRKLLNLALLLTSLLGFLEWGHGTSAFLFQMEAEVVAKLFSDPQAALHPFTVLPLAGQLLLLATLFQRQPGKWTTFVGMGCIGLLLAVIFIIGALGLKFKIMLSAVPFLAVAGWTIREYRQSRNKAAVEMSDAAAP